MNEINTHFVHKLYYHLCMCVNKIMLKLLLVCKSVDTAK